MNHIWKRPPSEPVKYALCSEGFPTQCIPCGKGSELGSRALDSRPLQATPRPSMPRKASLGVSQSNWLPIPCGCARIHSFWWIYWVLLMELFTEKGWRQRWGMFFQHEDGEEIKYWSIDANNEITLRTPNKIESRLFSATFL